MTRRTAPAEAEGSVRTARAAFSAPPPALRPDEPSAPPAASDDPAALPPCGPEALDARLAPLPLRALGLDAETARLMDRLGLRTIGALASVPRTALMRRFADRPADANPLVLLDRATGRLPEPMDGPPDPLRFLARARLPDPVQDAAPHLPALADSLCAELAVAGRGARLLQLTVYRVDGTWRSAEVATARATRDPDHLRRLLDGRLDRIDPGFGFDLLTLEALRSEPLALRQAGLAGGERPEGEVDALLDRLTARLGPSRVMWTHWRQSHLPERVEVPVPALGARPAAPPAIARERPLRLLDPAEEVRVLYAVPEGPPARFVWRRVPLEVARHEGPERIAPEWWRERPATRLRDYYKVEVRDGRRLWLYREGVLGDGRGRMVVLGDADTVTPTPGIGRPPDVIPECAESTGRSPRLPDAPPASGPTCTRAPRSEPAKDGGRARRKEPAANADRAKANPGTPDDPSYDPTPEDAEEPPSEGSAAVLSFRRPAMGEGPPDDMPARPLAAPAIHTGSSTAARPEEVEQDDGRVIAFSGDSFEAADPGLRSVELPPRWFVHGLFA